MGDDDVSHAWSIWSSAAEAALVHAYQFAGGPVPDGGLVLGRGSFVPRTVKLGGSKVRKARRNFADPLEGGDVFMYHDASTAVLLDLRCRFKAVGDLLGSRWSGIFGSVGLDILARPTVIWLLRFSMYEGGSLVVIWFLRLRLTFLLLLSMG